MSVLFVVLPVAIILGAAFVGAFVWATRKGQFDDLTTPALRALHDDSEKPAAPRAPEPQALPTPPAPAPRAPQAPPDSARPDTEEPSA